MAHGGRTGKGSLYPWRDTGPGLFKILVGIIFSCISRIVRNRGKQPKFRAYVRIAQ